MVITGTDILFAQLLARRAAVRLEFYGMKRRGQPVTKICREAYGIRASSKKQVLARMNQIVFAMQAIRFAQEIAR